MAGDFNTTCTLCGALWDRLHNLPPTCNHTDAEWEAYRQQQGLGPDDIMPHWAVVEEPPQE